MCFLLKMGIFHCYVSLPEGIWTVFPPSLLVASFSLWMESRYTPPIFWYLGLVAVQYSITFNFNEIPKYRGGQGSNGDLGSSLGISWNDQVWTLHYMPINIHSDNGIQWRSPIKLTLQP